MFLAMFTGSTFPITGPCRLVPFEFIGYFPFYSVLFLLGGECRLFFAGKPPEGSSVGAPKPLLGVLLVHVGDSFKTVEGQVLLGS